MLITGVTLSLVLAAGLAYTLWNVSPRESRENRSLRTWLSALLIQSAFWLLFVLGRDLPSPVSVVLVNTLSVLAMVEFNRAIREFLDRADRRRLLYGAVVGVALANVWFTNFRPNFDARVLVVSLPGAAILAWTALGVLRHTERPLARPARLLAAIFAVGAAALLLRTGDTLLRPGLPIAQSLPQQISLLTYAALPVFASLGFLMLQTGRANLRLAVQARFDDLTGALNRRAFSEVAHHVLASCARTGRTASLLLLDVDHFKRINDTLGHAAGDEVLCRLRKTLRGQLREEDLVGRLGGEEFVVLLPGADLDAAALVAERLRSAVAATRFRFDTRAVAVTVSIGAAQWSGTDRTIDAMLHRADAAMYAAKSAGRDRIATERALDAEPAELQYSA